MSSYTLCFTLASEASFGTGAGSAVADRETRTHPRTGLPEVPGSAILRILTEEASLMLRCLRDRRAKPHPAYGLYRVAAARLFGQAGASPEAQGALQAAEWATLAPALVAAWEQVLDAPEEVDKIRPSEIRAAYTVVRRQTAVEAETGAPRPRSLRSTRRVLRGTQFHLVLEGPGFLALPPELPSAGIDPAERAAGELLAATCGLLRNVGSDRRRGSGVLCDVALLTGEGFDVLPAWQRALVQTLLSAS